MKKIGLNGANLNGGNLNGGLMNRGRILVGGCVAGAALWLGAALPAQAGFEWAPPPRAAMQKGGAHPDIFPVPAVPAAPVESESLMTPEVMAPSSAAPQTGQAVMPPPQSLSRAPADPSAMMAPAMAAPALPAPVYVPAPVMQQPAVMPAFERPAVAARTNTMEGRVIRAERPDYAAPYYAAPAPGGTRTLPAPAVAAPTVAPVAQEVLRPVTRALAQDGRHFAVTEGFGSDVPLALALQQIVPADYSYGFATGVNPAIRISWDGGQPWNEVLQGALDAHDLAADITGQAVIIRTGRPLTVPVARAVSAAPVVPAAPQRAPVHTPLPLDAEQALGAPVSVLPPAGADSGAVAGDSTTAGPMTGSAVMDDSVTENAVTGGSLEDGQSYPRRDRAAARERMMNDAAFRVRGAEPAAHDPEAARQDTAIGDDLTRPPTVSFVDEAAPMPLMTGPARGRTSYMQLTGLEDGGGAKMDPYEIRYWQAAPGESLRAVMQKWASDAGVQLFWAQGPDYSLPAAVQMHGTFQGAVTHVLGAFDGMKPRPQGQLHPNMPAGPAVLIIDHAV